MTPLLTRLEHELAQCQDPTRRAELDAERGCYFARIGEFSDENAIVKALRQSFGMGQNARVAIWIMLLEGFILFFEKTDVAARDKFRRALAVSEGYREADLAHLAAAWLAHIEFNRSDFDSMVDALRKCESLSASSVHSARIRLYLTIASAYAYGGGMKRGREYYEIARQAAIAAGDGASISAIIYNKAAVELIHLRLKALNESIEFGDVRFVAMEIQSAMNYQAGAGHSAMAQLFEFCRAGVLMLEERYSEAIKVMEPLVALENAALGFSLDINAIRADLALSWLVCGQLKEAKMVFSTIDLVDFERLDLDNRIIFLANYIRLSNDLAVPFDSEYLERALEMAKLQWTDRSEFLIRNLDELAPSFRQI